MDRHYSVPECDASHLRHCLYVEDESPAFWARRSSISDKKIVKLCKVKNRKKKPRDCPACEIARAQELAKLEDGAIAALDNADSFACYAAVTFAQHIADHLFEHERERLFPKGKCDRWVL